MKSSIKNRLRITRRGKVVRRPSGFNHFRAKKSSSAKQYGRKTVGLNTRVNNDA